MRMHHFVASFLALILATGQVQGQEARPQDELEKSTPRQIDSADGIQSGDSIETNVPEEATEESDEIDRKVQEGRSFEDGVAEPAASDETGEDDARKSSHAALGVMLGDGHHGIWIRSVYADSPAAKAGLRSGERIATVNGHRYLSASELTSAIRNMNVGDDLTFHVWRNGQLVELSAKLDDRNKVFGQVARSRPFQRPHTAYRIPTESRQDFVDMHRRMMKLEDDVAKLRELVRDLQTRLDAADEPIDSPANVLEPDGPDVGLTDGAIELGEP